MLPLLMFLVLVPFAAWAAYSITDRERDKKGFAVGWGVTLTIFVALVWGASVWGSYNSYLNDRAFFSATKEQYRSALTVYKDHATIDIKAAAFTDFKYQGYQQHVADFIITLRKKVTKYNKSIVTKRVMKVNPLFNWMIVAPDDDMVPINLLED